MLHTFTARRPPPPPPRSKSRAVNALSHSHGRASLRGEGCVPRLGVGAENSDLSARLKLRLASSAPGTHVQLDPVWVTPSAYGLGFSAPVTTAIQPKCILLYCLDFKVSTPKSLVDVDLSSRAITYRGNRLRYRRLPCLIFHPKLLPPPSFSILPPGFSSLLFQLRSPALLSALLSLKLMLILASIL
jgi:hypothetical protein